VDKEVQQRWDNRGHFFAAAAEAMRRILVENARQLVEDPVAKIRFPKYLASSTLGRDGRTYYFVDEDTRREFEKG
jgi:YHS domain-containing protein